LASKASDFNDETIGSVRLSLKSQDQALDEPDTKKVKTMTEIIEREEED
jgi:hypothetical protein